MTRRLMSSLCVIGVIAGFVATPAASAQQVINFYVGGFIPHGFNDRGTDDVLYQDVQSPSNLNFSFRDFNGLTGGVEYLVGLSYLFDAGLGVGIYSRTATATNQLYVNPDQSEIFSQLRLRIVPITATFRYLPLGHHDAFVPYVGAGVGIYNWRYTESGNFAGGVPDSQGNVPITNGTFTGSGTAVGPVILGGIRIPVGHKGSGFGGEIRYQGGQGNLPSDQTFAGTKIDLGGFNYLFTINIGLSNR
jgi:outer membrane protein W